MTGKLIRVSIFLGMLLAIPSAFAKNIDLVTLPARESVQLTIYNSEDITLVKETRQVTFKRGMNKLQFSWHGTLIDPTSVEFRPLEHDGEIEVLDTVISAQKRQSLIWNVMSKFEGQVKVEVSYFTSGLTWSMDYVATVNPSETEMGFDGFVRVYNSSGEDYGDAQVRLVVGTINLVEKIANLARLWDYRYPKNRPRPPAIFEDEAHLTKSLQGFLKKADNSNSEQAAGEKRIIKEGLSEYFIFTIPGTETIKNGWSKRMRAVDAENVKFDIVYRMRSYQYGARPVRFFIWKNDDEHKLGESPLPNGLVRIFRENGQGGLSYLGQQLIRYVPVMAKIEVNLGADDLVVYKSKKSSIERSNFHFRWSGSRRREREYVDGWDETTIWVDEVRNYRGKPITVELRRIWYGDVEYSSKVKTKLFDYRTTETKFEVSGRGKTECSSEVITHNGVNAKKQRVKLKAR